MRIAGAAAALILLAAYLGSWFLRRELGIVRPAANIRYFTYTDDPKLDRALYVLYLPFYRVLPGDRHHRDHPDVDLSDLGP